MWPIPAGYAAARAMLIERVGGAPHGGFVLPSPLGMWEGYWPRIKGPLAAWRAANPDAAVANLRYRNDLVDVDFAHLAGLKVVFMGRCDQATITDAAFAHLRGIHTLDMSYCDQTTITDAVFAHLRGIHTLDMSFCRQPTITDALFLHLKGIHTLDMRRCNQDTITGATLGNLRGVRALEVYLCNEQTVAAAAALHLAPLLSKHAPQM